MPAARVMSEVCVFAVLCGFSFGCSSAPVPAELDAGPGAGMGATSSCGEGAPQVFDNAPIGWASVPDLGLDGTTGGEGGEVARVTTTDDFVTANARVEPLVIQVSGTIGDGRRLKLGSNKTILGVGVRPTVRGAIEIDGVQNVIVKNLFVVGNDCADADNGDCQRGSDAVGIKDGSHHVWIDHVDVSDGSDGNLDVNGASDYVTISWSKFSYSGTLRSHRYSNLIGSSDGSVGDRGKLRVTWHHCWWADNVQERMPRSRFGDVHVFNSYYSATGNSYCIRAGVETRILAEQNYFDHVSNPFDIENATGIIESRHNQFDGSSGATVPSSTSFTPPYAYTVEPATTVPCSVFQGAGPH
jgi:pectate lyase